MRKMRPWTSLCSLLFVCGCAYRFHSASASIAGHYRMYVLYGTGDTIIESWEGHGGNNYNHPNRKWTLECFDGDAVIAVMGDGDDFSHLWYIWCKFMFPYKPPSKGIYPYYPGCHVRNFTIQFFCYTALQHELTVNTFITGFYCDEFECVISRAPGPPGSGDNGDLLNPYKCCKTPKGYYIDYTACYYQPTHDQYGEFYDASSRHFLVFCATGYVMTGLSRKVNPWKTPDSDIDWLQCCRVAYGIKPPQPPPQANNQSVYSTPTIEMPTAYEYPPRRRSNQMAHSRFPADARSGGLSMNLEMTTNSHFQPGENTHPWMYNELPIAGEDDHRDIVTFSSDAADAVDNPHTSDDHYLEQLRNFFAPRSGGDNNPAQPLILSDDIPRIQSV